jgi:superfamily II DNA or RNA helicase
MEQWKLQLAAYLNLDLKDIGEIGAGKNKSNGILDIAMLQSMERKGVVDDRISGYGFVIVDECHHSSAVSFERVLTQAKSRYVLGLTATPYRKDGHQPIIHMQCGPISCLIKQKDVRQDNYAYQLIPRPTVFVYEWTDSSKIHELWPKLINDTRRNEVIINDIQQALEERRFPIILTKRREHLTLLESMLKGKTDYLTVLHGGIKTKNRKEILEELKRYPDGCRKVILATGSYIGEGFDDPRLDTLFLTMPFSFKGKLVQYAGRLHRYHKNKKEVRIYDYVDDNVSILAAMYRKRLKVYRSLGYAIVDANSSKDNNGDDLG